jgi:hypothetical protein
MKFEIQKEFENLKQQGLLQQDLWSKKPLLVITSKSGIIKYLQRHELFNKKQVATFAAYAYLNNIFFSRPAEKTLKFIAHIVDPKKHRKPQWIIHTYHPFIVSFIAGYIDSCDSIEKAGSLMYSDGSAKKYQYLISDARKLITEEFKLKEFNSCLKKSFINLKDLLNNLNYCCNRAEINLH